jgi:DNA-binding transcriptional MocR family regulator
MSSRRKAEVVTVLRECGIVAIEDRVNAFLGDSSAPLAEFLPDQVVVIDSLSKRLSGGLTIGFIVSPNGLLRRIGHAIRAGCWGGGGFALAAATRWMADGTADKLAQEKRSDAARRQNLAREILGDLAPPSAGGSYHLWMQLPRGWRSEQFVAAAGVRGVAILPASAFAVAPGYAPAAVRVALAGTDRPTLMRSLNLLRELAGEDADRWHIED